MAVDLETRRRRPDVRHWAGIVCLWAGLLGAASGIYLAVVTPVVSPERFSYPLESAQFAFIQVWFVVQHLGLLVGIIALGATGAAGLGRSPRVGQAAAVVGVALLTMTEGVAILAATAAVPSTLVTVLEVSYGISSTLIGVGLVMVGVGVLRSRTWRGWRRFLPLAIGVYVFVPMTPALSGPFVAARLAISGWMLLFALLGWSLMQGEAV